MKEGKQCISPPEFIVSVIHHNDEYMVGVTCARHKQIVSKKIEYLQDQEKIPEGKVHFSPLKAVGTNCIKGDSDDFIHIDP